MLRILVSFFIFVFVFVPNSFAANATIHKLERGLINFVTGPLEIPKEIRAHWIKGSEKTYHIIAWIFCGFIKGAVMAGARMTSGAYDIVSFPINAPKDYEPLLKPEYVFDNWPHREVGVTYKNLSD